MSKTYNFQRGLHNEAGAFGGEITDHPAGCLCGLHEKPTLNIDEDGSTRVAQEASVDGQGGTIRGKPVFTIEQAAYYLNRGDDGQDDGNGGKITNSGAEWFGGKGEAINDYYTTKTSKADSDGSLDTLTFGFYETQATLPEPYVFKNAAGAMAIGLGQARGFSAFTAEQRVATRDAIASWDDLIAVTFKETPFQQGDINFMNTTTGPAQASAYLPYDYGVSSTKNFEGKNVSFAEISGDVFVNPNQADNFQFDEGQYGLTTLIHEIGHSLGLEHPGNYNFGPGFAVNYVNGAEYYQDSNQYSIMSYWNGRETGAGSVDFSVLRFVNASTPLVHDIAAIQRIYGADMTTRTGDTTYGFNSNAGRDAFDFNLTPTPLMAIWDAGGTDTLDFSGFSTNSIINLNEGQYSSASTGATLEGLKAAGLLPATYTQTQLLAFFARNNANFQGRMTDNIGIAYGTTIENAIGGAGDDLLIGNDVANVLNGGAGIDTVGYVNATSGVSASLANQRGTSGAAKGDTLISIEALMGSNFEDVLDGSVRADTLSGMGGDDRLRGSSGNDTLSGGSGNDILDGGNDNDTLFGDAGDDQLIGGSGNDTLNGGEGSDKLDGGLGDDTLNGGVGNDVLLGSVGNDVLNGGAGDDMMTGGTGNDVFLFTEIGGNDVITDFRKGQDKIDLGDIDANTLTAGTSGFTFVGAGAFSNIAGQLRTYKEGNVNYLAGDVNGDGVADFTIATGAVLIGQTDIIFA